MNEYLTFDDVLILPNYSKFGSRRDTDISFKYKFLNLEIPIISSPMDTITGWQMASTIASLGGLGILHRFCSIDENVRLYNLAKDTSKFYEHTFKFPDWKVQTVEKEFQIGVSVGTSEAERKRIDALYEAGARVICVDVAHGHSKVCGDTVKYIKNHYPDTIVIAGSVATKVGTDYLVGCGADIIRVGIGGGSACETRIKTGIGVPQLSAIIECAKATDHPIIADGGIRKPADAAKALGAGASLVMLGGMLSGTDETPGETVESDGNKYKKFRGMASEEVNVEMYGKLDEWKTSEGVSKMVPVKGPVKDVLHDITGGLRSTMTYVGVDKLSDLSKRVEFIKVTSNTMIENDAHIKGQKI